MEKVEYFTIKPNLKQIYGKKVDKNTKFEDKTEDDRVHQTFENLTLTTTIKSTGENSEVKVTVPEGTILVWDEMEGFIVPQVQMCTLEEVEEDVKNIKDIYKMEG